MVGKSGQITGVSGPARQELVDKIKSYVEVTKPRSVFLLVFTALATMIVALPPQPLSLLHWTKAVLAIILACSGVNAVSCYVDRDIDAVMERTRHRPIPSGRIAPPYKALYWGLLQFALALALAAWINWLAFTCILLGMLGYVGVYSLWLKRRSSWNIILGGFSGGLPVLFGWAAVRGGISWLAVLLALLVVFWIPNHIWNLAIFFREDYRRVGVPMLPVVCAVRRTLFFILLTVVAMLVLSLAVYRVGGLGPVYYWTALISGLAVLAGNLYLYFNCDNKSAWWLYKLSSPYLFLLFLALIIDKWVR